MKRVVRIHRPNNKLREAMETRGGMTVAEAAERAEEGALYEDIDDYGAVDAACEIGTDPTDKGMPE